MDKKLADDGIGSQFWYAQNQKYDPKTRTFTASWNYKKGFTDKDGNSGEKLVLIFNEDFTKSVKGTIW